MCERGAPVGSDSGLFKLQHLLHAGKPVVN